MTTEGIADLQGLPTELIERLIEAVDSPYQDDWYEVAWYLVFAIGGKALAKIDPDTGSEPPPGSVGAMMRETLDLVTRQEYFDAIQNRLAEIVLSGVREDFVIRSLRDELTRQVGSLADDTAHGSEKREERVAKLRSWAEDPAMIARFRDGVAKDDPKAASMTDEEVAEQLREMAAELGPIQLETELDRWAAVERWTARAEALVSDTIIDEWLDRYSMRVISRGGE
jgi:hypothetical protein